MLNHLLTGCALSLLACAPALSNAAGRGATAFIDVNVVPMDRERILANQTLIVRNGRIEKVGHVSRVALPRDATRIDGRGKYLIPGLVDMHVHMGTWLPGAQRRSGRLSHRDLSEAEMELLLYAVRGITTVREMRGEPFSLALRQRVANGELVGPRIITSGPIIDGPGSNKPRIVRDAAEGRAAVEEQLAQGYDFIKIYYLVPAAAYDAIIATAHGRAKKVAGHVPYSVGIWNALKARQDSVEHLRGYDFDPAAPPGDGLEPARFLYWNRLSDEQMRELADATRKAGVWNCPTLSVSYGAVTGETRRSTLERPERDLLPPRMRAMLDANESSFSDDAADAIYSTIAAQSKMVKALRDAGAGLLAGTDSPWYYALPGIALHEELARLVAAGLSPFEALDAATGAPARYFGESDRSGSIAAAKSADLVLLASNPLADISAVGEIEGVMIRGTWHETHQLHARRQSLLRALSAHD